MKYYDDVFFGELVFGELRKFYIDNTRKVFRFYRSSRALHLMNYKSRALEWSAHLCFPQDTTLLEIDSGCELKINYSLAEFRKLNKKLLADKIRVEADII